MATLCVSTCFRGVLCETIPVSVIQCIHPSDLTRYQALTTHPACSSSPRRCFEGIKKLEMNLPGDNERKQYLSLGIQALDGACVFVFLV